MERQDRSDLLADAVEIAASYLQAGEPLSPFMITDRWGDRRVDGFEEMAVSDAKTRLREFVRSAGGDERCALAYVGRVGDGEDAIVIERANAGQPAADVFVQRFRPKRGRLRGFKLLGQPRSVGTSESVS